MLTTQLPHSPPEGIDDPDGGDLALITERLIQTLAAASGCAMAAVFAAPEAAPPVNLWLSAVLWLAAGGIALLGIDYAIGAIVDRIYERRHRMANKPLHAQRGA